MNWVPLAAQLDLHPPNYLRVDTAGEAFRPRPHKSKKNYKIMKYKNNPLNIRHSSKFTWNGEVANYNGFCVFSSEWSCYRAALIILSRYKKRNLLSIRDIICTWAPTFENPTTSYMNFVSSKVGISPYDSIYDTGLSITQTLINLLYWMSVFEQGTTFRPRLDVITDCVTKHINLFS